LALDAFKVGDQKMNHGVVAPVSLRRRYLKAAEQCGVQWVYEQLGVSRGTLANLVAGFHVMPAVVAVAEARIDTIEAELTEHAA